MKLFIILQLTAAVIGCAALQAVPQTIVGVFGQSNPGNLPVEEWFRDPTHWEPGAKLPGPWLSGTTSSGLMMRSPGAVFGINAESVVVNRDDKGAIANVQVFYDADTAKIPKSELHKRVAKAVALFTGADGKAAGYTVALTEPNAGAVTATLKR